jgi:hypothetical protein
MKNIQTNIILFLIFLFSAITLIAACSANEIDVLSKEKIGQLKIGMTAPQVIKILGNPEKEEKLQFSEVTGNLFTAWYYNKKGIVLGMITDAKDGSNHKSFRAKPGSPLTVDSITIKAPCRFLTAKGMGIGSSYNDVAKTYSDYPHDKEFSDKNRIVIGSIYGGLMFDFEKNKVVRIFMGAAAE